MILAISQDQWPIFATQHVNRGNMVFDQREDWDHMWACPCEHNCKISFWFKVDWYNHQHISLLACQSIFFLSPFQTGRTQPGSLQVFKSYENKTQLVIQNHLSESSYSMGDLRKQEKKKPVKFTLLW